jgi:hypothetical protein
MKGKMAPADFGEGAIMFWKRKRIGLALRAGGAKGLAHLGVLLLLICPFVNVECDFFELS